MNLDDMLRASADDVASRVTPPTPDPAAIRRRARRTQITRVSGAAAAAVAVVGAIALGLPQLGQDGGPPVTNTPTPTTGIPSTPPTTPPGGPQAAPESPRVMACCVPEDQAMRSGVEYLADPMISGQEDLAVAFTIQGDGWHHFGAWVSKQAGGPRSAVSVLISDVEFLPRDACNPSDGSRPPGADSLELGTALADLEDMTVLQPPTQGQKFGYPATHVRLQGPDRSTLSACQDRILLLWAGGVQGNMASVHDATANIHDLWLLEMDGQILAIEQTWFPETPASTLQELQALIDSMLIDRS
jgi:hypothetical protein